MNFLWSSDFPLIFFGGFAIVFTLYAVMKYGRSKNFFRWKCFWRIGILEIGHIVVAGGIHYAIHYNVTASGNYQYEWFFDTMWAISSLCVHGGIMGFAHELSRSVGRRRLIHTRARA